MTGVEPLTFPPLQGKALDGTPTVIPTDLVGDRNLVVLAFRQWQQRLVDGWLDWAVDDVGLSRGPQPGPSAIYEVPVLARYWSPARRFIDGGMATSIGDPDILARTITVYTHVSQAAGRLGIDSLETVHAFVVTRHGEVLARASGDPAVVDRRGIRRALLSEDEGPKEKK
ncbi:MAG: hypothetical protein WAN48_16000 [Actinomycetes bacterium]